MAKETYEIKRGVAQILNNYGVGNVFDHGKFGVTMRVREVHPKRLENVDANKVAQHVRSRATSFRNGDDEPWASLDGRSLDFFKPWHVRGDLYPLTMVCEMCNRVVPANSPGKLAWTKGNCPRDECKGKLEQLPFVVVHDCGEMFQVRPTDRCPRHDSAELKKPTEDTATWYFQCGECPEVLGEFGQAFCKECNQPVIGAVPTGSGSIYYSRRSVLVDVPPINVDESKIPYGETWARILLAAYLDRVDLNESDTLEKIATTAGTDQRIQELVDKYGKEKVEENLEMLLDFEGGESTLGRDTVADLTREDVKPPGIEGDDRSMVFSSIEDQLFTFLRSTRGYEGPNSHLDDKDLMHPRPRSLAIYLDDPDFVEQYPQSELYGQKFDKIHVSNAWVADDFPLLNLLYGYSRSDPEAKKTDLRQFENPYDDEQVPIYCDRSPSEAIILELDRAAIVDWLVNNVSFVEEGDVPDRDDEEGLKKWFFNNMYLPDLENPFTDIEDDLTEIVYTLIHSQSHALLSTASDQCGLETDSISELLLPGIPAIILYAQSTEHFALGGMFTLFKTRIHPWVDNSVEFTQDCLYDTACIHDEDGAACHACLQVGGLSCEFLNKHLDRKLLIGGGGYEPFWDI